MGRESSPAEESTAIASGAGGAIVEPANERVTRLGGVLARRRPPSASPSNRRMPEPNIGDRNSYGSCVHEFRTAKLRRGSRTFCPGPGAARMVEDYYDFPMGSDV